MSDEATTQFSVPETVESIDLVPEKFRSLYVEKDGKFTYQDPAVLTRSLSNAKRERDEAKRAAAAAESWKRLGKTPEEIEDLLNAQAQAEEDKAKKAGDWETYKTQMGEDFRKRTEKLVNQHTTEVETYKTQLAKLQTSLEERIITAEATSAIAEMKGVPALLMPHVQRHVKVVEEDGRYMAVVLDARGEPRVNARGDFLTIKDLVAEMRDSDVYSRAFDASGTGGGGAPPGRAGGAGKRSMSTAEFMQLGPKERATRMAAGLTLTD